MPAFRLKSINAHKKQLMVWTRLFDFVVDNVIHFVLFSGSALNFIFALKPFLNFIIFCHLESLGNF